MMDDWPMWLLVAVFWVLIVLSIGIAGRYADPIAFDPAANYGVILP